MDLFERLGAPATVDAPQQRDPFAEVKNRVHMAVIGDLGPRLFDSDVDAAVLRERVTADLRGRLAREAGIAGSDRERLVSEIADDILGHGPLERLLADDTVTEIMVNGPYDVWVERKGRLHETPVRFVDESHLRRIINKMVAQVGRRIDESSPLCDARLLDGSRVNAVIPPLSLTGPLVTIRKFSKRRLDLNDLVGMGSLSPESVDFLHRCVRGQLNILISGGTGSGKTTMLNAMSTTIPNGDRIVTIEDAAELRLNQRHVLRLEARPKNIEGEGEIRDPRARAQLAAHAAGPDHRRRGPRRRGRGHAAGDEHRPRWVAVHRPRQLTARRAVAHRDHGPDGRVRPAGARHPPAGGLGARPDRAPRAAE